RDRGDAVGHVIEQILQWGQCHRVSPVARVRASIACPGCRLPDMENLQAPGANVLPSSSTGGEPAAAAMTTPLEDTPWT
ncbi:MAG TPA: hypothetical protein VET87_06140, partial [Rubrivivax sp.]|nr:hypothetical protein [Rubrivivax sp.]